jgi:hypothetical protein
MNKGYAAFLALVITLTASNAHAAEAVWPKNSASDLSLFVTELRYRIYAERCSSEVPRLKPEFDNVIAGISSHLQDISRDLLASDMFRDMKSKPVPARILDALRDSFDDLSHNVGRLDAVFICPKTLKDFAETDEESLKSALTAALSSVKNMIQRLGEQTAP